jgi:hypothetical protein
LKFLPRETAKRYHNSDLVDRAYSEGTNLFLPQVPVENVSHKIEEVTTIFAEDRQHMPSKIEEDITGIEQKAMVLETTMIGREEFAKMQKDMALHLNNEDAAICSSCGSVMVRNGSCYKCLDCGETSGCS